MTARLVIVTGYFGAPTEEFAKSIASERGYAFLSMDEEIVKKDGRSISRICMMGGEHAYRNEEYELLDALQKDTSPFDEGKPGLVVYCGDGVLYDDMSREIAKSNEIIIVGSELTEDELWEGARQISNSYHAFMNFGSNEQKRASFFDFYQRQNKFFTRVKEETL